MASKKAINRRSHESDLTYLKLHGLVLTASIKGEFTAKKLFWRRNFKLTIFFLVTGNDGSLISNMRGSNNISSCPDKDE
jgi:hypothetical protein